MTDIYRQCFGLGQSLSRPGDIHRCCFGQLSGEEQTGDATTRFRYRRVLLLQHESLRRESMHNHFRRIGSRQNRSGETYYAVHCECIWRQQFLHPGDQGYGSRDESSAGELRKCEDAEE